MADRAFSMWLKPVEDLTSADAHELHRSKLLPTCRTEFGDISHHPRHLNSGAFDGDHQQAVGEISIAARGPAHRRDGMAQRVNWLRFSGT
jgi:hypothetical protein